MCPWICAQGCVDKRFKNNPSYTSSVVIPRTLYLTRTFDFFVFNCFHFIAQKIILEFFTQGENPEKAQDLLIFIKTTRLCEQTIARQGT